MLADARDQNALAEITARVQQGDLDGARGRCEAFLGTIADPARQAPVRTWLGMVEHRSGNLHSARAQFELARQYDRRNPRLTLQLGLTDFELGSWERADSLYREAIRQEPELLALLLPVLRADIRAIECYAPDPDRRVRCPVQVYGGIDDRHPVPAQLGGWQRVAEREVRVRLFAGDHFYLTTQRDALTADIAARWAEASAEVERV